VLIGLVIGAVGLKALATVLQAQLFATAVFDPLVLGTVALVVTACAFAACVVPAREAARTDAVSVLANT
jgi:ABC-type antimicrobial peptide transport system permease subunit